MTDQPNTIEVDPALLIEGIYVGISLAQLVYKMMDRLGPSGADDLAGDIHTTAAKMTQHGINVASAFGAGELMMTGLEIANLIERAQQEGGHDGPTTTHE